MSDDLVQQISHLIDIKRLAHARELVNTGLHEAPEDITLLFYSALIYYLNNELAQGIKVAQYGLSIDPFDEELRHILSRLYQQDKKLAEAELIIIDLIRENPRNATYLSEYAQIMLLTFHIDKAKALVAEALRVAPTHQHAQLVATLIDIVLGKAKNAEELLQELLRDDPESESVLHMLLLGLVKRKKNKAALVLAQELLRKDPFNEDLITLIIDLRAITHWTALPLWPTHRFGTLGVFAIWALFLMMLIAQRFNNWPWFGYFVFGYLAWCAYSWFHGPLIRRYIKKIGAN
jgi:tetratricopeptide (TPR) repeat protein